VQPADRMRLRKMRGTARQREGSRNARSSKQYVCPRHAPLSQPGLHVAYPHNERQPKRENSSVVRGQPTWRRQQQRRNVGTMITVMSRMVMAVRKRSTTTVQARRHALAGGGGHQRAAAGTGPQRQMKTHHALMIKRPQSLHVTGRQRRERVRARRETQRVSPRAVDVTRSRVARDERKTSRPPKRSCASPERRMRAKAPPRSSRGVFDSHRSERSNVADVGSSSSA